MITIKKKSKRIPVCPTKTGHTGHVVRWIGAYNTDSLATIEEIVRYEYYFRGLQSAELVFNRISLISQAKVGLLIDKEACLFGYISDNWTIPVITNEQKADYKDYLQVMINELSPVNSLYHGLTTVLEMLNWKGYTVLRATYPAHPELAREDIFKYACNHCYVGNFRIARLERYPEMIIDKDCSVLAVILTPDADDNSRKLADTFSKTYDVPVITDYIWNASDINFDKVLYNRNKDLLNTVLPDVDSVVFSR